LLDLAYMSEPLNHKTAGDLAEENARMRRVLQILHDSVCPADSERFPHYGPEVCRVFWMPGLQQEEYWYRSTCEALGLVPVEGVPEWNPELNLVFQTSRRNGMKH
jgi:hypothetical protein